MEDLMKLFEGKNLLLINAKGIIFDQSQLLKKDNTLGLFADLVSPEGAICLHSGRSLSFGYFSEKLYYLSSKYYHENISDILKKFADWYLKIKENAVVIAYQPYPQEMKLFDSLYKEGFIKAKDKPYNIYDVSQLMLANTGELITTRFTDNSGYQLISDIRDTMSQLLGMEKIPDDVEVIIEKDLYFKSWDSFRYHIKNVYKRSNNVPRGLRIRVRYGNVFFSSTIGDFFNPTLPTHYHLSSQEWTWLAV